MLRILPDTNVLLGIRELDLLMRCHAAGILEVVWCDELLDEFERKLVDVWGFPGERAVKAVQKFTAAAPGGRILPGTYTGLVGEMTGKDPDGHVLGAAARAGADILLTHNLDDFPSEDLGADCAPRNPGDLFASLAQLYPEDLAAVVRRSSAPQCGATNATAVDRARSPRQTGRDRPRRDRPRRDGRAGPTASHVVEPQRVALQTITHLPECRLHRNNRA